MIKLPDIVLLTRCIRSGFTSLIHIMTFIFFSAFIAEAQSHELKFKAVNPSLLGDADMQYIFFSKSGKMWFSSASGLTSFDGSRTTFYNKPSEVAVLGNALIGCIQEDSRNNFWIGTHHKGMNYFESRTGKFTKIQLLLKGDSTERRMHIQEIFIESDSSIWIATTANGFFIYNPLKHLYRHYNLDSTKPDTWRNVSRNTPKYFARDPLEKNKIWIGAYDGIYSCHISGSDLKKEFIVPTGIEETEDIPASFCRIQKIDLPGNDTIWFSTWAKGMGYCDIKTGNTKLFPDNKNETNPRAKRLVIQNFCRRSGNEYYVACNNYLPAVFNTHTGQYNYIQDEEMNKTSSSTYDITFDHNNILWICKGGGLYFHSPDHKLFNDLDMSYQTMPAVIANLMRDIFWDPDEKAYYVSLDVSSGVYILDTLLRITKILSVPLIAGSKPYPEASVWKTLKDGSNRLWTFGNIISVLPDKSRRFKPASELYPKIGVLKERVKDSALRIIKHAAIDDEGNILILSGDKVYTIYHKDLRFDSIVLKNSLTGADLNVPPTVLFDKKRRVLYASGKNAIHQYDLKSQQTRQLVYDPSEKNSLPQQTIGSFALDGQGNLWVSIAEHGIRIFDPLGLQVVKELTLENSGIPVNTNVKNGGPELMLIVTNIGMFVYNINNNTFLKLNRENGMKVNTPPGGSAVANNILFLGMRDTIQYMPIKQLSLLKKNISPYISGVKISGFELSSDTLAEHLQLLKLEHKNRTISFDFSAIEFQFPERIHYAYELGGVDETWNYTDNHNRTITYSNLSPGKYTFRVKANLQKEEMLGMETTMLIIITPPFWETWWFRLLVLVIVAALLGTIINYRIRQIRKKAWSQNQLRELEMKALKAQMNPHFIYNALNSIQALVLRKKDSEASIYIGTFGRLLRQVLTNSDKTVISLENEMRTLELYIQLEQLRMNMDLKYSIHISDKVNADEVMLPPLIFQPFVENALWHGLSGKTGEKKITINVGMDNSWLKAVIEDNGIGRKKAAEMKSQDHSISPSKGIEITTRRLTEFNRTLSIKPIEISDLYDEALQPAGTRVIINIKAADQ